MFTLGQEQQRKKLIPTFFIGETIQRDNIIKADLVHNYQIKPGILIDRSNSSSKNSKKLPGNGFGNGHKVSYMDTLNPRIQFLRLNKAFIG